MKAPRQLHVFVLIDALGWSLIENSSFLREYLPHRQGLRTQLGFSSGVIPSILSGLTPAQNGIWNLVYFDPDHSPFRWMRRLNFLPYGLLDNRLGRRFMTELGRRALGLGPGFDCCVSPKLLSWFNWTERRNIYARGGLGATPSIFDQLAEQQIPYCAYSYRDGVTDQQILTQATIDVRNSQAGFFFLYLCEMDGFLHAHCDDAEKIADKLAWYEQNLDRLFAAALRRDPEAKFFLFSDHGMAPVRRYYDLVADIEACAMRMPLDYLAVYDSTMARFWFFSPEARAAITDCLRRVPCGRLLPEAELRQLGVFFPDNRYGEAILLMEPGTLISTSGFNGAGWKPAGMHGYHPDDPHSEAVFLTNREPLFPLATVTDIYRCMRESVS